MAYQDVLIVSIALLISCSGLLINLFKKGGGTAILFQQDGKTLLVFRLVIPAVLLVSMLLYFSGFGHYMQSEKLVYLGYLLVLAGLALRWIAVLSLGNAFKVKVTILKDQPLKTDGIYKRIRHPSYTGLLMYYMGLGLIMQNGICLFLLVVVPLLVVLKRIKLEELVLNKYFGAEYKAYTLKTRKLFPYIF